MHFDAENICYRKIIHSISSKQTNKHLNGLSFGVIRGFTKVPEKNPIGLGTYPCREPLNGLCVKL